MVYCGFAYLVTQEGTRTAQYIKAEEKDLIRWVIWLIFLIKNIYNFFISDPYLSGFQI